MESRVKNAAESFVEGAENFVEGAMNETPKEGSIARKLESATSWASSRTAVPNPSHVSTSLSARVEASAWWAIVMRTRLSTSGERRVSGDEASGRLKR